MQKIKITPVVPYVELNEQDRLTLGIEPYPIGEHPSVFYCIPDPAGQVLLDSGDIIGRFHNNVKLNELEHYVYSAKVPELPILIKEKRDSDEVDFKRDWINMENVGQHKSGYHYVKSWKAIPGIDDEVDLYDVYAPLVAYADYDEAEDDEIEHGNRIAEDVAFERIAEICATHYASAKGQSKAGVRTKH